MMSCKINSALFERKGRRVCRTSTTIPCVCSLEKLSVENVKMTTDHAATRSQAKKREDPGLFDLIVGRLASDDDVVNVAFAQAGGRDAHEPAVLLQFAKIGRSTIAHPAA